MGKLILSIIAASSCWGAVCTSHQSGNWNDKATWGSGSGCVSAHAVCSDGTSPCPGLGDTVTVNHAVAQNVPDLVIGVNGAAPQYGYMQTIAGGGGTGYTSCTASIGGGTAIRGGTVGCSVVNGVVTPYIADRGWYLTCPTVTVAGVGGSGGTFPGTLTCQTGGGTPAVTVNGTLTLSAANTYVRGSIDLEGAYGVYGMALSLNPGTNLYMDMSQSAGAMYAIAGAGFGRQIIADCSSSQCSIQGYGGTTTIDYLTANDHLMVFAVKNVLFKNVGDASTRALTTADSWDNDRRIASIVNSTFDSCGIVDVPATNMGMIYNGNTHRNTPIHYPGEAPRNLHVMAPTAEYTAGIRWLQNNSFDGHVDYVLRDFTITGNVFGGGLSALATTVWKEFTDNFWLFWSPYQMGDGTNAEWGGSMTNVYFLADAPSANNPHFLMSAPVGVTLAVSNLLGGFSGHGVGDSGEWIGPASNSFSMTIQNSIFLCDSAGIGSLELSSPPGPFPGAFSVIHNTWCGGLGGFGMIDVNETGNNPAGYLTVKSNIAWDTDSGSHGSLKVKTIDQPGTQDVCTTSSATVSNCDYNAGYRTGTTQTCPACANQGRGYAAAWSYTPGYHDVDGQNPRFVDAGRKAENFDRKYLNKPLAAQWSGAGTYAYGDMVSNSDAAVYQGEVFNFRCTNPSGCTGLGGPGIHDTAWRANWEWASLYWLRELTSQNARFTDGAVGNPRASVVQSLNAWVRAGFVTQSPSYWGAGHDGKDIGAVHLPAVRRMSAGTVAP